MTLVELAHTAGRAFTAQLTREEQREAGQFMTPPAIANFMAQRLVAGLERRAVRVLEPSAGGGILAAATIEALLALPQRPEYVELLLCEQDERLVTSLRSLAGEAVKRCADVGVELVVEIVIGDFLLSELALSGQPVDGLLVIANPPFFKLNKATPQAAAHAYAVRGQPNIYGLFMAACARLTPPNGRWCFITPRSWMNGSYFTEVRRSMLRHMTLDSLHVFESRREGFEEDAVLQETVITWASGRCTVDPGVNVLLTKSQGTLDLGAGDMVTVAAEQLVGDDEHVMLSLPKPGQDPFEGWTATLRTYGFEVSTGPVVAFRQREYIRENRAAETVPLLWLQHVGQQRIEWPINKKREHIRAVNGSAWMLVKNQPMVLMRRFSPKEDERRVTCAAYACALDKLPGELLGLENHLNYIHRRGGTMTPFEARGLSAFLASRIVDDHFRAIAGSTQVNATELRKLPLPPLAVIQAIGQRVSHRPSLAEIDRIVEEQLGFVGPLAAVS